MFQPFIGEFADAVFCHTFKNGDEVSAAEFAVFVNTGFHRAAGSEDGGDIQTHCAHEHTGNDFVAVGQLSCASQEYFYPEELREFTRFRKDTYADSPTDFIHWERFSELKRTAKYNELDVDLEKKLQEIINECSEIRLDARLSVRLNEDKEYVLYWYGEEVTAQEDLELINFCGWINNLNILKRLYEFVGEEGDFPIFIESDFDSDLGQYKDVLIKKLRETGRQVFIISQKRDEGLEKLCDKVLVLN